MKNTIRTYFYGAIAVFSLVIFMSSCEDVIDVDLPTEEPRLIIDALIRVDTNEAFTKVIVKVSQTSSFFETIPAANIQQLTITNLDIQGGGIDPPVLTEEEPGSGIYSKIFETDYLTQGSLFLQVDFEDKLYVATTQFIPAVPFDKVEQGDGFLFDEEETEVIIAFTDLDVRDDFYLFDFDFANYLVTEDEFYQGQQFEFSYYYDKLLVPGDTVNISLMGVDQEFYNYMDQLITQSEGGFGPFSTPSLTVRGNIINATDIDNINNSNNLNNANNFALGYFAIVQEFKEMLVIEE